MEKELREKIENAAVNLEWDEIEVVVVHSIAKDAYQLGEKSKQDRIDELQNRVDELLTIIKVYKTHINHLTQTHERHTN